MAIASRFFRYGIVGVAATVGYFLVALGLDFLGLTPFAAGVLAYFTMLPLSFTGHKSFTFRSDGHWSGEAVRFALLSLASAGLSGLIPAATTQFLGMSSAIGYLITCLTIPPFNFIVSNTWVFPAENRAADGSDPEGAHKPNAQYSLSTAGSFASRAAARARRRMLDRFLETLQVAPDDTILDVGATSDQSYEASNYLEAWCPGKERITAVGLDDAGFLETRYPGVRFVKADGKRLPFADGAFDVVHSSAVLEHVGSAAEQERLVRELARVARRGVFITTPNRWFPLELHTLLPMLHWLPKPTHRRILRLLGMEFFARESNLNLVGSKELNAFAQDTGFAHRVDRLRTAGLTSNLLLILRR